ncbi:MAG TPA: EamA family transporter [Candidatus Paceibacterota bacterium]|nr:EamA family transporter [Candidatus Paceibacterota bacterium]
MPPYLSGILVGFLEPVLHAWSNIIDNHFSNAVFPRLPVLLFFGVALNIVFLPITFLAGLPVMLPVTLLGIVFVIAIVNVVYAFPYYLALRDADTSVVASLFSLGRIFVPVLAYFILGEVLTLPQYAGFFVIILSSALLTLDLKKLKVNRAFFLMLACSFVLAFQTILYKFVFDAGASWPSVVAALTVFELVIAGAIMFATTSLRHIREDLGTVRRNWKLFVAQQGLEWGGNVGASYAISILQVTVAQAIASTQPFFVLLYAVLFKKWFPNAFNETTARGDLLKKGILFACIILGTVLVVAHGPVIDV